MNNNSDKQYERMKEMKNINDNDNAKER